MTENDNIEGRNVSPLMRLILQLSVDCYSKVRLLEALSKE